MNYIPFMQIAIQEAEKAMQEGDVPVGAVLIDKAGNIISRARNQRELSHDPTAHAEVLALREASHKLGGWRLSNTVLIVTLEPCMMCAGALIMSRVSHLVYGASDPKAGAVNSLYNVLDDSRLNHQMTVEDGVLAEESRQLLQRFFRERRRK